MSDQSYSWYVRGEGNQPTGPFTTEELIESLRSGRLDANTICWREGLAQWLPMSQVEPFASAIQAATSPSPVAGNSTSQPLPWTPPPSSRKPGVAKASPAPAALKLLPYATAFVVIAGAGVAYLLFGGLQQKDAADDLPREATSQSPSTEASASETKKGSGRTDQGKMGDTAESTNQKAEGISPFGSPAPATTERSRFSDTVAFYEKNSEILELKKDGTFYLDKSLYRAIYKNDARQRRGQRNVSDLLEEGRKGETFPGIDSDGVSGQWRKDEDAIIIATGSGMSLRMVRKGDSELVAEGTFGATWLRWDNWEEDWNRLQRSRAKVGIRRPEDNDCAIETKSTIQPGLVIYTRSDERGDRANCDGVICGVGDT